MPILVKDYEWSQTEENIYISVPLKGVKGSKADIFSSKEFIKISYPPFLFEVLLFEPIDNARSIARIKDGCVIFNLLKEEKQMWSQLSSVHSDDKAYVLKKKQEAIEQAQKQSELEAKEKSEIKEKTKKYSLKEMMKLEENDRTRIEEIKERERNQSMKELEEWKEKKRIEAEKENLQYLNKLKDVKLEQANNEKKVSDDKVIFDENPFLPSTIETISSVSEVIVKGSSVASDLTVSKSQPVNAEKVQKSGPRARGKIIVKFTPRVFPTPQRESKSAEENEWLQKQASARKQFEIEEPDLAEHEKDPQWLKDKGRLYLNRAACHLKLRNLYKCAEDCSTALDFMQPKVEENAKGRLKAHLRRAAAFCELELYVEGYATEKRQFKYVLCGMLMEVLSFLKVDIYISITASFEELNRKALQDYEAALMIEPKNLKLKEDAAKLRSVIQNSET